MIRDLMFPCPRKPTIIIASNPKSINGMRVILSLSDPLFFPLSSLQALDLKCSCTRCLFIRIMALPIYPFSACIRGHPPQR
ncbi:hypothetical protein VTK26DRAFT_8586 [Humicola hyalothermophila]